MLETILSIAAAGLFSFVGAFVAVRTQIARLEANQQAIDRRVDRVENRLDRVEAPFFAALPTNPTNR
jgi:hypothetical protein